MKSLFIFGCFLITLILTLCQGESSVANVLAPGEGLTEQTTQTSSPNLDAEGNIIPRELTPYDSEENTSRASYAPPGEEAESYDQYRRILHRYVHVSNCGPSAGGPCPANKYCTYCMYISRRGEGYRCQNLYDQNQCASCPAGKTSPYGSTSSSACLSCGSGKYRSSSGCVDCPVGRYYGGSGATDVSSCQVCSAGYYSGAGAAACSACPAGSYTPSTMYGSCQACDAGKYQSAEGQASCNTCGAGKAHPPSLPISLSFFAL